jgi:HAE1 family hydrophobic/amphiphilic exporter-1
VSRYIGYSLQDTDALAAKIKGVLEDIPGAVDVSVSREADRPEIRIAVDREKAASLGLDMKTVASTVKTFVEGTSATKYREAGRTYDIYVRLEETSRGRLEDIENISIVSPVTGKQVKLSNFARVYETAGPIEIERKNRERVVYVEANTFNRSSGSIVADLKRGLSRISIPYAQFVKSVAVRGAAQGFQGSCDSVVLGNSLVYMSSRRNSALLAPLS